MTRRVTPTRQAILDAAIAIAGENGITAATMDDIAVRAGVAKGSLYYNFESKDAIFSTLLGDAMQRLADDFTAATEGTTGIASIRILVTEFLDMIVADTAVLKVLASEYFRTDRVWIETFRAAHEAALAPFEKAVREIAEETGHRPERPRLLATAAFGAILVAGLEWLVFEPETPREVVANTLINPVVRLAS